MKDLFISIAIFVGISFVVFVAYNHGKIDGKRAQETEAIKAGVAEYRVNPQTGETSFVYKSSSAK